MEHIKRAQGYEGWEIDDEIRPALYEAALAGSIAGFIQSFIACPVEVVKARMQVQGLYRGSTSSGTPVKLARDI
jgi:hypothetical protein